MAQGIWSFGVREIRAIPSCLDRVLYSSQHCARFTVSSYVVSSIGEKMPQHDFISRHIRLMW